MTQEQEIKAMAKAKENGVAIVGNQVYEGSKYASDLLHFTRQKYLLLNHYHAGMPLQEAADKVHMELDKASEFIDSPKAVKWLEREAVKDYARQKWADGGEWVVMGDDCLEGKKHLSKDQQIVFQAFGDRFLPKSKEASQVQPKIVINIDAGAVQDAMRRQNAIDAELAS